MWPYVLLGIFLLIGLILYSPLVLKIQYEEKLSVWLRFWFIKVTLLPKKEKPVKKKNLKKSQKKRKPQSAADVKSQPAKKSGWQNLVEQHGVVGAIEQIASVFLLLPKYGMHGYFISFLITHLLNFLLSLRLLIRTSDITIPFYIPALTLAAVIGAAWGASLVSIPFWRIFCFLALFSSLLVLFRIISKEDLRWISGLIQKK
jgi:hypothetical protein